MPDFRQNPVRMAGIGAGSLPSNPLAFPSVCVSPGRELPTPRMGNDPCPISAKGGVTHARFLPRTLRILSGIKRGTLSAALACAIHHDSS